MDTVRLGDTGLQISPIVLGCMSYGVPERGNHSWSLPEDESRESIKQALEAGLSTFDTANAYSDGTSEEILGRALRDMAVRDEVVVATKVFMPMGPGPNSGGLSRVAIMREIDHSLRRLGMDHVDLYQIHRFDPHTPIEETMEALHDVVRAGKARYLGASSMYAWQFAQMQHAADLGGWTRFVAMQDQYNLLQREEEREMLPYCQATGVGVIPWSPLARGRLTRDWDDSSTARSGSDNVTARLYDQDEEADRAIARAVAGVAEDRGVSRAQVALAWVRQQSSVTAPIVGATKPEHLADAVASIDLEFSADELEALAAPYTPRQPEGF